KENNFSTMDEFYAAVALRSINLRTVYYKLFPKVKSIISSPKSLKEFKEIKTHQEDAVYLEEIDHALIKFSKCCNPIPYDDIIGFITMGKGISIHKKNCPNVRGLMKNPERIMNIKWNKKANKNILFNTLVRLETIDRPKILSEITQKISQMDINISSMSATVNKKKTGIIDLGVQIKHLKELQLVLKTIKQINGVHHAYRVG
ncbi:MAG: ACT domain-containing protein, partial [Candidatus Muiribacteriota bacterium]